MKIDKLIKEMEEEYAEFLKGTGLDNQSRMEEERKNNPDCNRVCTANEMMLGILHKYQKLQEIMVDELKALEPLDRDSYRLARIKEIMEI